MGLVVAPPACCMSPYIPPPALILISSLDLTSQVLKGEGPVGLVVAPTRELAEQIHKEARKFAKPYSECVYGI